jgi:hypothetical protein
MTQTNITTNVFSPLLLLLFQDIKLTSTPLGSCLDEYIDGEMCRFSCSQQYSVHGQDTRKRMRFNSNPYMSLGVYGLFLFQTEFCKVGKPSFLQWGEGIAGIAGMVGV